MKRKLSTREWVLLVILALIVLVSAYVMLFYIPTATARDNARAETEDFEAQLDALQVRLAEKQMMERELGKIFEQNENPRGLADYDNQKAVMLELNSILAVAEDIDLSFSTPDTSESVVRREISIKFKCGSYTAAKDILQRLHDSQYRCMLDSIDISEKENDDGGMISVSGTIVFFECQ